MTSDVPSCSSLTPAFAYPHHEKVGPCYTRPAYRDGRIKKAVKVYTVALESFYLLLFGVPSIDLEQALRDKCRHFGSVETVRKLSDYPEKEKFTDVFLVKLDSVESARRAKRSLDDSTFYGGRLHVCYAPEYETSAESRVKLHSCRRTNARIARKAEHDYMERISAPVTYPTSHADTAISKSPTRPDAPRLESTFKPASAIAFDSSALPLVSGLIPQTPADAIDDAHQYWLERGASFMTSLRSSDSSANSCNLFHFPSPELTVKSDSRNIRIMEKAVPLPVQQALSWKPYHEVFTVPSSRSIGSDQSIQSKPTSYPSGALVPRCLRTTARDSKGTTTRPVSVTTPVKPTVPTMTVGELKRLAFTLGPEQGPSLPSGSVTNEKKVVFHGPPAKKPRLYIPPHPTKHHNRSSSGLQ